MLRYYSITKCKKMLLENNVKYARKMVHIKVQSHNFPTFLVFFLLKNKNKSNRASSFYESPSRLLLFSMYYFSISIIMSTLIACLPPSNSFSRKLSRMSMARQEPITLAPMQSTFASLCCLVILAE